VPVPAASPVVETPRWALDAIRGSAIRILLAEDNITNQQVALGILKGLGMRADAVADGAEALRSLETIPYDLVLMDVQMPELDGLEATRRIRDAGSAVLHHDIPIVAMTANAREGDREQCLQAGMNDYVTKPVSPAALARALERWLPLGGVSIAASEPAAVDPRPDSLTFDRAGLVARLMGNRELARLVVGEFLADIPKQIEALKHSLAVGETGDAIRLAHSIKGASANVGGELLRPLALELEKAGQAGDVDAMATGVPLLELEFARLKEAMHDFSDPDRSQPEDPR